MPSSDPETATCPSSLNDTPKTLSVWASSVLRHRPVSTSHTLTFLSSDPEATRHPSPLSDTLNTLSPAPSITLRHSPVCTSHTRIVLSADPETARHPSALSDTLSTLSVWPRERSFDAGWSSEAARLALPPTRGRHTSTIRLYSSLSLLRQSICAYCLKASGISASSSLMGTNRLSAFEGSRKITVSHSNLTHFDAKALADIQSSDTRERSNASAVSLAIIAPGGIERSSNQTRRPSFLNRSDRSRTVAASSWL